MVGFIRGWKLFTLGDPLIPEVEVLEYVYCWHVPPPKNLHAETHPPLYPLLSSLNHIKKTPLSKIGRARTRDFRFFFSGKVFFFSRKRVKSGMCYEATIG